MNIRTKLTSQDGKRTEHVNTLDFQQCEIHQQIPRRPSPQHQRACEQVKLPLSGHRRDQEVLSSMNKFAGFFFPMKGRFPKVVYLGWINFHS